ncbi:MAG: DUF4115 domain-containing protein [Actinomycetota bacterium]|nr:DUF4115 domain-containing protein [Actinomycetota bacterium]
MAAFVVVLGLVAWSRRATVRAERRSVQSYGRALGVLGDVSRRSDHHVVVPLADEEEVARPHVRANDTDQLKPAPTRAAEVPAPRVRLQPPVLPGVERASGADDPAAPVAPTGTDAPREDLTMAVPVVAPGPVPSGGTPVVPPPVEADRPMLFDDALEDGEVPRRSRREMRNLAPGREHLARRAATGAAAAVVAGALAVGGYELASSRSPSSPSQGSSSAASTSLAPRSGGSAPPHRAHPSTTTTAAPAPTRHTHKSGLQPTSVSSAVVSYTVPSSSYTLTVTASAAGACWVGVQPSANASSYLWMDTLAPGATASYKATGTVAVRVGNPRVLSLRVNGQKVNLPPGRVQVYDVVLSPSQGSA